MKSKAIRFPLSMARARNLEDVRAPRFSINTTVRTWIPLWPKSIWPSTTPRKGAVGCETLKGCERATLRNRPRRFRRQRVRKRAQRVLSGKPSGRTQSTLQSAKPFWGKSAVCLINRLIIASLRQSQRELCVSVVKVCQVISPKGPNSPFSFRDVLVSPPATRQPLITAFISLGCPQIGSIWTQIGLIQTRIGAIRTRIGAIWIRIGAIRIRIEPGAISITAV